VSHHIGTPPASGGFQLCLRRALRSFHRSDERELHMHMSDEREVPCEFNPKLLEILACPLTKTPLLYDSERQELISEAAALAFPIRDGIPIMLPQTARKLP
jgi:uncharacterized protein